MKDDERDYCDFYMQTCLKTLTNKYRITLRIVLYGPSGAGKTSILKLIKTLNLKDVLSTVPSVTVEREIKKLLLMKLIFFALPGQKRYLFNREMLVKYLSNADALFYVVDSANPASFRFARIMLHHTLSILATLGKQIPIFILANKQDLPNALPIAVIRDSIWSPLMKEFPDIKVYFFAVSVLNPTTVVRVINECLRLYLQLNRENNVFPLRLLELTNAESIVIFDQDGFPIFFSDSENDAYSTIGLVLELFNLIQKEIKQNIANGFGIIRVGNYTLAFVRRQIDKDYSVTIAIKNFHVSVNEISSILTDLLQQPSCTL